MKSNQKLTGLITLLSMISLLTTAQTTPRWMNDDGRESTYPAQTYFRGFATGNVRQGETVETAKKRLLKDAQGLLAEDIRVTVKSEITQQSLSTKVNKVEQIETTFKADVQTAASAEIAGIHSEPAYYDAASGLIYAFVYVKRADLAAFYRNQINLDMEKVLPKIKN
jgi:hypothetical protein